MDPHEEPSSAEPLSGTKKKKKGGAEKVRDKRMKLMKEEAKSCRNLLEMFSKRSSEKDRSTEIPSDIHQMPGPSTAVVTSHHFSAGCQTEETPPEMTVSDNVSLNDVQLLSASSIANYPTDEERRASTTTNNMPLLQSPMTNVSAPAHFPLDNESPAPTSIDMPNPENLTIVPTESEIVSNYVARPSGSRQYSLPQDLTTTDDERASISIEENYTIDLFARPEKRDLEYFFRYHPKQPEQEKLFNSKKAYTRRDGNRDVRRKWLSYDLKTSKFFCCICLAFSKGHSNVFVDGFEPKEKKHVYDRLADHEKLQAHLKAVDGYILFKKSKSIDLIFNESYNTQRRRKISNNRLIVERIYDVVKVIGKQCLSFRGKRNEAAYSLLDENLNHGVFLELILLLARYDPHLQEHIEDVAKNSENIHSKGSKTGGSSVTFLSKTFVNYILAAVCELTKQSISTEVVHAGMFSVQIDSTCDYSMTEQCSIVLRYVKPDSPQPCETLFALKACESTTGSAFYTLVKTELGKFGIDIKLCVASSTDGASSMQGKYSGFVSLLKNDNNLLLSVWCHSHVLNLVIIDCSSEVIEAASLFGLLNKAFVFIRDSYKRMKVWKELSNSRGLTLIGETRWWAKAVALKKIFGTFGNYRDCHYSNLVLTLDDVSSNKDFPADARATARGIMESLTSYKTIMTAHIFMKIFVFTTPLSNYLQTKGMDFLTAFRMVEATTKDLQNISRDYSVIKSATNEFVSFFNEKLKDNDIVISDSTPGRIRKKRTFFDYEHGDSLIPQEQQYEVNIYNRILDIIITSLERRFAPHKDLYSNYSFLDPRNFSRPHPSDFSFRDIVSVLEKVGVQINENDLINEYTDFVSKWPSLKPQSDPPAAAAVNKSKDDDEDEEDGNLVPHGKNCHNCIICVYTLLTEYNFMSSAYRNLHSVYKLILTISITQVECERSFSKLKIIKTRLRQTLTNDNLEALILMACEPSQLSKIDFDLLILHMCEMHPSLRQHFFV